MYITTSKNASKELIAKAKTIALSIPSLNYISRSKRSLQTICKIMQKKSQKQIFVLGEKNGSKIILKYKKTPYGYNWDENALRIDKLKTTPNKIEPPFVFEAKGAAKKISDFLCLQNSIHANLYDEPTKLKVALKTKTLSIKNKKDNLLECKYELVKCPQ